MTAALGFEIHEDELAGLDRGLDWAVVLPIIAARRIEALRGLIAHRRIAGTFTGASAEATVETAATLVAFVAATERASSPSTLRKMRSFALAAGCKAGPDLDSMLVRVFDGAAYVSARDAGRSVDLSEAEWTGWRLSYLYPCVTEARLQELLAERERARLKARDAERNRRRRKQDRSSYVGGSVSQLARELGTHHMTLRRQMAKAGVKTADEWRKRCAEARCETASPLNNNYRRGELSRHGETPNPFRLDTPSALPEAQRRASVARLLATALSSFSVQPARSARPSRAAR